jgi:hypothetical protein
MSNWTPIFRAGTHTDSGGHTRTFTREDLDKVVDSYDPQTHEAPLVIGHPRSDSPAYGWVKKVKRAGDVLLASFDKVAKGVAEAVAAGRYKKKSISIYPDGSLRHVGLLGAVPPAVKGLGDVAFNDGDDWQSYEYTETKTSEGNMNELEKALQGKAEAEARAKAAEEAKAKTDAKFSELQKENQALKKAKEKTETEFAEHKKAAEAKDRKKAEADREARFNELVKADKVLPAEKEKILKTAARLAQSDTAAFAEGEEENLEADFWALLESREGGGLLGEFSQAPDKKDDGEADASKAAQNF